MTRDLEEFGIDLTAQARAGRLDPTVGRAAELSRLIRILSRKTKNNPILLGEPGVGKTAIVEGLAQRVIAGDVPPSLAGVAVFSLNLGNLLAGTSYRGDFEQRLQRLVAELRRPGARTLLFVDEIHLLGRAGRSEGGLDAANLLKPLLARGELPCIGASTATEWQELVARDPALERRFQPILIAEPSAADTLTMLRALRRRFEEHHRVEIGDDALAATIEEAIRTRPDRRLPDKAVDLLDEACAFLHLQHADDRPDTHASFQLELAAAQARFDLDAVARLRFRVWPSLAMTHRPKLDAGCIRRVAGEATATATAAG